MDSTTFLLIAIVFFALAFDFTNGFHDAANAIATAVSTRALSPLAAVSIAATMNLAGALISTKIAITVVTAVANPESVAPIVIVASLIGSILWNLLTWYLGLPTSSSHALLGGLAGGVLAFAGVEAVKWQTLLDKFIIPTLVSPVGGLIIGFLVMSAIYWIFRKANPVRTNKHFKLLQIFSASFMAFSHGSNDAQKTMGVITFGLISLGMIHGGKDIAVPFWVIISAASAISLGTFVGGWKIIKTMGMRITKLEPVNGFAAETTAATILFANAQLGFPVSTTHVITSSIMGVGAAKRFSGVRWSVARSILFAWAFTLPGAAFCAACSYWIISLFI